MKKNLFALALSLAAITFFSCATTNGKSDLSAQNAADESGVLDTDDSQAQKAASAFETPDSANEPADSGGESGQGQEAAVLGSGGEASKSAESAPEEKIPESEMRELEALLNDNPAQGDSQSEGESGGRVQYGSLLEKIKAASKNDGENAAQSQDSDEKKARETQPRSPLSASRPTIPARLTAAERPAIPARPARRKPMTAKSCGASQAKETRLQAGRSSGLAATRR